jgi:hypothetical protein
MELRRTKRGLPQHCGQVRERPAHATNLLGFLLCTSLLLTRDTVPGGESPQKLQCVDGDGSFPSLHPLKTSARFRRSQAAPALPEDLLPCAARFTQLSTYPAEVATVINTFQNGDAEEVAGSHAAGCMGGSRSDPPRLQSLLGQSSDHPTRQGSLYGRPVLQRSHSALRVGVRLRWNQRSTSPSFAHTDYL